MFEIDSPFKIEKTSEILGIDNSNAYVINEIANYLFGKAKSNSKSTEKVFDINLDYKYYYADFYKLGIDLNNFEIDWWSFNSLLESIILDEHSTMYKIISYRTYEKPSKNIKLQEEKEHKFRMSMKRKYALPAKISTDKALERLWNYVEKKAGENKA